MVKVTMCSCNGCTEQADILEICPRHLTIYQLYMKDKQQSVLTILKNEPDRLDYLLPKGT